jgi:hypothetical protein
MALANQNLITALRKAAINLENGNHYEWGHHGSCNCGNLLQASTDMSKTEIFQLAQSGNGEYSELAEDYCGIIDAPFQYLISKLQDLGLNHVDVHNIEYLSDSRVLQRLEGGFKYLNKNQREDVIQYFNAFAALLKEQLDADILIKDLVEECTVEMA